MVRSDDLISYWAFNAETGRQRDTERSLMKAIIYPIYSFSASLCLPVSALNSGLLHIGVFTQISACLITHLCDDTKLHALYGHLEADLFKMTQ